MNRRRASGPQPRQQNRRGANAVGRYETVEERLREPGCDPIAGMAKLAQDETLPTVLRARIFAELAHYVAPRVKAADLTGADGIPLELMTDFNMEVLTDQELETLAYLLNKAGK